jgi:hypothetical protein
MTRARRSEWTLASRSPNNKHLPTSNKHPRSEVPGAQGWGVMDPYVECRFFMGDLVTQNPGIEMEATHKGYGRNRERQHRIARMNRLLHTTSIGQDLASHRAWRTIHPIACGRAGLGRRALSRTSREKMHTRSQTSFDYQRSTSQ